MVKSEAAPRRVQAVVYTVVISLRVSARSERSREYLDKIQRDIRAERIRVDEVKKYVDLEFVDLVA